MSATSMEANTITVHVYIALGSNVASATFTVPFDENRLSACIEAKRRAAFLWSEPIVNLSAHVTNYCQVLDCAGGLESLIN